MVTPPLWPQSSFSPKRRSSRRPVAAAAAMAVGEGVRPSLSEMRRLHLMNVRGRSASRTILSCWAGPIVRWPVREGRIEQTIVWRRTTKYETYHHDRRLSAAGRPGVCERETPWHSVAAASSGNP